VDLVRNKLEAEDLDIVLCDSLIDENDDFYDLTFKMSLDEHLDNEELIWCQYKVSSYEREDGEVVRELRWFLGYTNNRVIYNIKGIGVMDTLLESLPRNPPTV